MSNTYLKTWLDRVERLEEEQKGIGADKRDIYAEAKSKGYNTKALRRIVAARKRKDEDEVQADIDTYKVALGLAVDSVRDGLSLRESAKKHGVSKSSIHRALAVPAVSQPHSPETGEITEPRSPVLNPSDSASDPTEAEESRAGERGHAEEITETAGAVPPGSDGDGGSHDRPAPLAAIESCGGVESRHASEDTAGSGATNAACDEPERVIGKPAAAGVAPGPQDPTDDLAIPMFLRRAS